MPPDSAIPDRLAVFSSSTVWFGPASADQFSVVAFTNMSTASDAPSSFASTTSENRNTSSATRPVGAVKLVVGVVTLVSVTVGPAVWVQR